MFSYILLFFSAVLFLSKGSNLKIEKKLYSLLTTSALFSYSILGLISIILISIDQSRFPTITLSIIIFFITIFFNKNYLKAVFLTHCNISKFKQKFKMLKKYIILFIIQLFIINPSISMEKETTFNKDLFNKAQSDGKIVIVSSWIKYCSSCASQMKVLNNAKNEGKLLDIKFDNIEYFAFDVTNRDIANSFDVLYQTTLLIFKGDTEVYRSIGEVTEDLIYQALKASI